MRLAAVMMAALFAALCLMLPVQADETRAPDIVLDGTATRADHQSYIERRFTVPEGTGALTVAFDYTGREARTTLDLGLFDPNGFRGWSGGNKARFTVAESFATPSYLPGALPPGVWRLIIGVPNIRPGIEATYTARIWFDDGAGALTPNPVRAETGPGWRRGDLHTHTGHSDGSCDSLSGRRVPCPVHHTVDKALEAGLDFVVISDHNTISHHNAIEELRPYYDTITIIPGTEITTFFGHANLIGVTDFVDFRIDDPAAADRIARDARAKGAILSINHPLIPSDEDCMGCGWSGEIAVGAGLTAVEAVGGGIRKFFASAEGPIAGVRYWETLLNQGHRLTGIGGSDNHDALNLSGAQPAIGAPATVVWTQNASQDAILEGVRSGRVFIDLGDDPSRRLDLTARTGDRSAVMGGILKARAGDPVTIEVHTDGLTFGLVEIVGPSGSLARLPIGPETMGPDGHRVTFETTAAPDTPWLRANLRALGGDLLLIGNPVYIDVEA